MHLSEWRNCKIAADFLAKICQVICRICGRFCVLFWLICGVFFCSSTIFLTSSVSAVHTISVNTSGAQTIDIIKSSGSVISTDSITVSTTCRSGYNFAISTSVNDNNLYLNGDSANNTADTYFSPSNGISTLSNASNTWGYYYDNSIIPTESNIFSPVPALGNTDLVKTTLLTPSATDINDNFNIYYGVSLTNTIAPGSYKMIQDSHQATGTIVYYITVADNCVPYTVSFNHTSTVGGNTVSGTGTMSDQEIYRDTATNLTLMAFTPPSGYTFKEWNTMQDGSGTAYADEESVTNIANASSTITLYAIWEAEAPTKLYDEVASMVKKSNGNPRTQSVSDLQTNITVPTSNNPATDTSNSGVYLYDSNLFGEATDAPGDYDIYYYRGVLDTSTSSYGSNGLADAYPNYVKLDNNTCWRIIRTTATGGVKMIYNGTFGATTADSCANATTNAQLSSTSSYTGTGNNVNRQVVRIGYTYRSNYATTTNSSVAVGTLFGNDANYSNNTTGSSVKTAVESWYNNNLSSLSNLLETNAGFCNDRSSFTSAAGTTASTNLNTYGRSSGTNGAYFGAYIRNANNNNKSPSLACSRTIADVYSTGSANGGNKQLGAPIALITADEAAFAGSGSQTANQGSTFHANSFLRTGSDYLTMSPSYRQSTSSYPAFIFYAGSNGYLVNNGSISTAYGVRPVISLVNAVAISSGNGTATNPWTVEIPATPSPVACNPNGTTIGTNASTDIQCMQDFTSLSSSAKTTIINNMATGAQYTLMDKRDAKTYTVAKLADGKVWMTQNLDLDLDSGTTYTNLDTDLGWNGTSYSTASWTPIRSTYATTNTQTHEWCVGGVFNYSHCEYNHTPESYDPGDLYWNGAISGWSDWNDYFNSCNYSTNTPSCDASLNPLPTYTTHSSTPIQQYHLGNYYNWAASVASNNASSYGAYNGTTGKYDNLEANQSICPAGWRLPYAIKNSSTDQAEGDFVDLWTQYGWNSTTSRFSDINNLTGAPLYFLHSGDFFGNIGYIGYASGFQASVAYNDVQAYSAGPYMDGTAYPSDTGGRSDAFSIRCLLR